MTQKMILELDRPGIELVLRCYDIPRYRHTAGMGRLMSRGDVKGPEKAHLLHLRLSLQPSVSSVKIRYGQKHEELSARSAFAFKAADQLRFKVWQGGRSRPSAASGL